MVMAQADQADMIAYAKVTQPIVDQRVKHTRWVVTRYPTQAPPREAQDEPGGVRGVLFSACCIDWEQSQEAGQAEEADRRDLDRVRITAPDTDLAFSIDGCGGVKCDGVSICPMARSLPPRSGIR